MYQLTLSGYVGRDVELRTTNNGKSVCDVSVAVTHGWGENKKTVWWKCVCWGATAENASKYLYKGSRVLFQGVPEFETYEKDGKVNVVSKMTVGYMEFLGGKSGDSESRQQPESDGGFDDIPSNINFGDVPF